MPAEKNSQPPFKIHLPLLCLKFWEDILAGTILTSSWQPCTDNWSYPAHQTCRVLPIAFTAVTKPLTRMQHTLNSRGETETKDTKQKHQPRKQETSRDRQAETHKARLGYGGAPMPSAVLLQPSSVSVELLQLPQFQPLTSQFSWWLHEHHQAGTLLNIFAHNLFMLLSLQIVPLNADRFLIARLY